MKEIWRDVANSGSIFDAGKNNRKHLGMHFKLKLL